MTKALDNVRSEIRSVKNSIDSKRDENRKNNNRLEDIENILRQFYTMDYNVNTYNNNLKSLESTLEKAIVSERARNIEGLSNIVEKESSSDNKLSTVISELKSELAKVKSKIDSTDNKINSLKRELNNLRTKERELIMEFIRKGD